MSYSRSKHICNRFTSPESQLCAVISKINYFDIYTYESLCCQLWNEIENCKCYTYDEQKRNQSCFRVQSSPPPTMSTAEKRTAQDDKEQVFDAYFPGLKTQSSATFFHKYYFSNLSWIHWAKYPTPWSLRSINCPYYDFNRWSILLKIHWPPWSRRCTSTIVAMEYYMQGLLVHWECENIIIRK